MEVRKVKSEQLFSWLLIIFIISGTIHLIVFPKQTLSLWFNQHHTFYLDILFRYITWLGDGITILLICMGLLFIKYRYAVIASISALTVLVVIYAMKTWFNLPRPSLYFKDIELNFVKGVTMYQNLSFPSGHTAGAFCIYLLLALFFKRNLLSVLFFILAFLTGISRIYLLQHFLIDVVFGAMIGSVIAYIVYTLLNRSALFADKTWLEKSLIKRSTIKN